MRCLTVRLKLLGGLEFTVVGSLFQTLAFKAFHNFCPILCICTVEVVISDT